MSEAILVGKTRLEASKSRLAVAFRRLEQAIEGRVKYNEENNQEIEELKLKLNNLIKENEGLATNFLQLNKEYSQVQNVNKEVLDELNSSIKTIESILK